MKKVLSLVVALSFAALFSSAALAGADCSYHQTQAAVSKTDASKNVVMAPDKADSNEVKTAQADQQPVKLAPAPKK